ncbi:MAG: carboxyl transferase domain-containing protein [Bacteroidota bacterium]
MEKNTTPPLRQDLDDFQKRKAYLQDENRPEAIAKRHTKGYRSARENIDDLCDDTSFLETGSLIVAGQRGRKTEEELYQQTPADGLITGIGAINGHLFDEEASKCFVLSYDYTVLAGTQGGFNHKKTDRVLQQAQQAKKPVVFFVEGGGGRPGDVDFAPITVGGLDLNTWVHYSKLSGKVARIAIVNRYCFAGNAAIAGCADVIIATKSTSLGMGGPAMIAGGGLGNFHPKEIGPAEIQAQNGVIDILVEDEAAAVQAAKQYLSYFQGRLKDWQAPDQIKLRELVPENRKFAYSIHKIINQLCDEDSVLELRAGFAKNMVTALVRIAGRPMGLIANSTRHLGGAIDSDAADKASRFMQLCDAFGLPILSLCDAPGFMVGPEHEKQGLVRHSSRMFLTAANIQVPLLTVVLRKAYGLGAMAMAGGSFHNSFLSIAWPTAEFGAMGLEGAVQLGFRKELEAATSEEEREALYQKLVKAAYRKGQAIAAASSLEFDEVIDPKDTRVWIKQALETVPSPASERYIDAW